MGQSTPGLFHDGLGQHGRTDPGRFLCVQQERNRMAHRGRLTILMCEANQPPGYADFLRELKDRIRSAQVRAALAVNHELVSLYWQIGRDILTRQQQQGWGAQVIGRLAGDLRHAFPDLKGFSLTNLKYMRAFAAAW